MAVFEELVDFSLHILRVLLEFGEGLESSISHMPRLQQIIDAHEQFSRGLIRHLLVLVHDQLEQRCLVHVLHEDLEGLH